MPPWSRSPSSGTSWRHTQARFSIVREAQLVIDTRNATRGIDSPKIVRC